MSGKDIAAAIERAQQVFARRPAAALQPDSPAIARWLGGLKAVSGVGGAELVTDVPAALGGGGEAPSPGSLARAALAACTVTCIAMAAARAGIELERLEAETRSRSDVRGLLGVGGAGQPVDPGPLEVELIVRIAAPGVSPERLCALAEDAQAISPIMSLFQHATPVRLSIEAGG